MPQYFPAFQRSQQFIVNLCHPSRFGAGACRVAGIQRPVCQLLVQLCLLGFQLFNQAGQGIVFTLFFEAEFFGRCFLRCHCRGSAFVGVQRLHGTGFCFFRPCFCTLGLQQPILDATFVVAPLGVAFVGYGAGHHIVQKRTVMADQKHRAIVVLQQLFQQFQGVDVQVVGRFIQHQNIGGAGKQAGEQQAVAFAT